MSNKNIPYYIKVSRRTDEMNRTLQVVWGESRTCAIERAIAEAFYRLPKDIRIKAKPEDVSDSDTQLIREK